MSIKYSALALFLSSLTVVTQLAHADQNYEFPVWEDYVENVETKDLQTDEVFPIHPKIDKVYLALGWDPAKGGQSIDIDSNIHVLKNETISKRVS
ncbi:MAG: hypothetical protein HRU09_19655 [Oligoflexales bacterium]|nr:hypothetical protein [Oligoflexales bacterium]